MQNRPVAKLLSIITLLLTFSLVVTTQNAKAQGVNGSSNITFSPYTMYGIGDILPLGTASSMSMGGIGVGLRSGVEFNYLNPASLSSIPRRTALFSIGIRGNNYYSKTPFAKTAYSDVSLSDLGIAFPLYRGIAVGLSLTPITSVGYNSTAIDDNKSITEDIGRVIHNYTGDGGISKASLSFGFIVVKGFSVGVSADYYFGNVNRYQTREILPLITPTDKYNTLLLRSNLKFSTFGFTFGGQYSHRVGKENVISIGATYQPKVKMDPRTYEEILNYSAKIGRTDTLHLADYKDKMDLPAKYSVGIAYTSKKLVVGVDWSYQDWTNAFDLKTQEQVRLKDQQDYKFGIAYTPNRISLRSALQRWTYKFGAYYSQTYLVKNNKELSDLGFTFGVDIPFKRGYVSKLSFGIGYGRRGTFGTGQVKDSYFKVFAGISLFGSDLDFWFFRKKFD